jgi:TRAP-type mannitol/chloroaromatic compound transport system permease small subunit
MAGQAGIKIIQAIESLSEYGGRALAWLAVVLVAVTGLVVLLRYGFQFGSIALQESILYINALLITAGAAYTLKHDGHVRVDIFYARLTRRRQLWINLLGTLLLLLPTMAFIIWISWDYVALSWRIRERSAENSGLPYIYLLKSCVIALPGLLLWQGIAELLKNMSHLRQER